MRAASPVNRFFNISMGRTAGGRPCGTARQEDKCRNFPSSAGRRETFNLVLPRLHLFVRRHKTLQVAHRVVDYHHLPQVVLPHIGFDGSPGERLAADGFDFASAIHAGVGHRWHNEAHLRTFFPKRSGEIMRENQGIKSAFSGEEFYSLLCPRPFWRNVDLEPAAKLKAVGMGLVDECEQSFLARHATFPCLASYAVAKQAFGMQVRA
jgi:hypothetical protein